MDKIIKTFTRSLQTWVNHHNGFPTSQFIKNLPKNSRYYHNSSNTMKVTVLGAGGNVGKTVSLMLKQSPFIDELCLYDTKSLENFANDLNYIDTKCKVTSYHDTKNIEHALCRSNVIVIFASCHHSDNFSYSNLFDRNAPRIKELGLQIAKYSPKSVVAIGAEPIHSMVPLFSEVMKKHGHYNPCTIFGITTIDSVRTNKFVAEILGLDPECVLVPVIGGHTDKTIVPVLSKAVPCNELTNEELEDITKSVRKAEENLLKIGSDGVYLSHAFAAARFLISLVKALRGQNEIVECAYVKSKAHPQLKYMVAPVLLGPGGIAKCLDIPELSDYESCLLDNAIPLIAEDIKKGECIGGRPMHMVDGVLQDKPLCDPGDVNPKAPRCPPDHCELQSLFVDN